MTLRVFRSRKARDDLVNHFAYIHRDNPDAAERFILAFERATELIAERPEIGSFRDLKGTGLKTIRLWPLEGFEKYLLVYHVRPKTILVVRVMHASQDYNRQFPV